MARNGFENLMLHNGTNLFLDNTDVFVLMILPLNIKRSQRKSIMGVMEGLFLQGSMLVCLKAN